MADDKLCYRLGSMNMTGTGTEVDLEKSRYYLRKRWSWAAWMPCMVLASCI